MTEEAEALRAKEIQAYLNPWIGEPVDTAWIKQAQEDAKKVEKRHQQETLDQINENQTLAGKIKHGWLSQPEKSIEQHLMLTEEDLLAASSIEFLDYMELCLKLQRPQVLVKQLRTISQRLTTDVKQLGQFRPEEDTLKTKADQYSDAIARALLAAKLKQGQIPPEVGNLCSLIHHEDGDIRKQGQKIIKNVVYGDVIHDQHAGQLLTEVDKVFLQSFSSEDQSEFDSGLETANLTGDSLYWESRTALLAPKILETQINNPENIKKMYVFFANVYNVEKFRAFLRRYSSQNPNFKPIYDRVEEIMGFDTGKKKYGDLMDLYREHDFRNYKANEELNRYEKELLSRVFKPGQKVLDIAMGPEARHMVSLQELGVEVAGFDFSREHVDEARRQHPDLDIRQASWADMPYESRIFDGASFLGRSFAHNTTIEDAWACLRETRRVLKNKKDAKLLIDMPQQDTTHFEEEQRKFRETCRRHGIWNFNDGSLVDGPSLDHRFDRLVYSDEQFIALTELSGFKAKKIQVHEYSDADGSTNVNNYWELSVNTDYVYYLTNYEKNLSIVDPHGAHVIPKNMTGKMY